MRIIQLILEHPVAFFIAVFALGFVISGVTTDIIHATHGVCQ